MNLLNKFPEKEMSIMSFIKAINKQSLKFLFVMVLAFPHFGYGQEKEGSIEKKDSIENKDSIESGFYYKGEQVYPEKFAQSKTNIIGAIYTFGLAGGTKSHLAGVSSRVRVNRREQIFTLVLHKAKTKVEGNRTSAIPLPYLYTNQVLFTEARSPLDFGLVQLTVHARKRTRWVRTGKMGLASGGLLYDRPKKLHCV